MFLTRLSLRKGYQGLLFRILFWVVAEIFLNYIGVDDLADYSEYLFDKSVAAVRQTHSIG